MRPESDFPVPWDPPHRQNTISGSLDPIQKGRTFFHLKHQKITPHLPRGHYGGS